MKLEAAKDVLISAVLFVLVDVGTSLSDGLKTSLSQPDSARDVKYPHQFLQHQTGQVLFGPHKFQDSAGEDGEKTRPAILRFLPEGGRQLQQQRKDGLGGSDGAERETTPDTGVLRPFVRHGDVSALRLRDCRLCGDGLCRCCNRTADCSHQPRPAAYIPALPASIVTLNFGYNRLQAVEGLDFFQNVTNLTELSLAGNDLALIQPGSFATLRRLTTLNLHGNRRLNFTAIATVLSDALKLQYLDLSHIGLGLLPSGFLALDPPLMLMDLNLAANQMTRVNLSEFASLKYLEVLNLGFNELPQVTVGILPLPVLKSLTLSRNNLSAVPLSCMGDNATSLFPSLRYLNLDYNQISALPNETSCFATVKYVNLTANLLETLTWANLHSLKSLKSLLLQHNHLRKLETGIATEIPLQELDLRDNELTQFPETCVELQVESATHFFPQSDTNDGLLRSVRNRHHNSTGYASRMRQAKPRPHHNVSGRRSVSRELKPEKLEFRAGTRQARSLFPNLLLLMLSYNQIPSLPGTLCLPQLQSLYLSGNRLGGDLQGGEDGSPGFNFSSLASVADTLQTLDLGSNELGRVVADRALEQLESLNVGDNDLYELFSSCDLDARSLLPRLGKLDLSWNNLQNIPSYVCLPNLRELNLQHNMLTVLSTGDFGPDHFPNLTRLVLDEQRGPLTTLDVKVFANPSLVSLSLLYNNLPFVDTGIRPNVFDGCINLQELNLAGNYVPALSGPYMQQLLAGLTSLRRLELFSAGLLQMGSCELLAGLPHLEQLSLAHNLLAGLPDRCFDQLPELQVLKLEDNTIPTLGPEVFPSQVRDHLQRLDLSANPLVCDQRLVWLCAWMKDHPYVFGRAWGSYNCSNMPNATVLDLCSATVTLTCDPVKVVVVATVIVWTLVSWLPRF